MLRAKKSLGQNFLKSKKALSDIVRAGDIQPTDTVLEVGPGKGFLTEALLEKAGKVIAVEKDEILVELLKGKFAQQISEKKLELVGGDVLNFSPTDYGLLPTTYKVVANIPYYITGVFLRKFLSETIQPSRMVLMVQKEVAQRIVARDQKESILSISVKAYGTPKYIDTVEARYFSPAPKVDSAIIAIENISKDFFKDISEEKFFETVKAGFAHKRKQLMSNLKSIYKETDFEKVFTERNLDGKVRAEDITLEDWEYIARNI